MDIVEQLREETNGGGLLRWCHPRVANEAATEIARLREKCDKQARIIQQAYPEYCPDVYFITGHAGNTDSHSMPEEIHVCPSYGVDWIMVYKRTDKVYGPEW